MIRYYLCFFFLPMQMLCAQIKKDTTFTIQSELRKNRQKYPVMKEVPEEKSFSLIKITDIVYDTLSGRPLHLDAFINRTKTRLPSIVIIHGGGWKSGSKEMQNAMAEKLAAAGYQIFTVEYRLSDEAKYPAGINDVLQAIQYIRHNAEKLKVDASKTALLGASSGAQVASLIGTKYPAEVHAIINIDGILAFHHPDSMEGKYAALWLGGTYEEIPEVWMEASALSHVSKKTPPFLFINSQFKRFSAGQVDMIKKLNTFGIDSRVEKIENSPHAFWLFEPWFTPTVQYITEFLNVKFKK